MIARQAERGATALIVVVFTILLLMTISVGFVRLVVRDQTRTIDDELSRGAYDSAMAGVEDGKRVLQACLGNGNAAACTAIADNKCNTVHGAQILSGTDSSANLDEVKIRKDATSNGETFDQAYTCVKIDRNTKDYQGSVQADTTQIVPLDTEAPFTEIVLSWFLTAKAANPIYLPLSAGTSLPALDSWSPAGQIRPPILRAQIMQYTDNDLRLDDFDQTGGSATLYLNPSGSGLSSYDFVNDDRRNSANTLLKPVLCTSSIFVQYACSVTLRMPNLVRGSVNDRRSYLRLTSVYGDTDFLVEPQGTELRDVQPAIDSTGRANNVFRRVRARVEMTSNLGSQLYPRATIDITKNLCKDFTVSPSGFDSGVCDPTQP